jgi:hypothetical protein
VHGNDEVVIACGGAFTGVILELQGDTFVDVTPADTLQMNGTFAAPDGQAITVGREGEVAFRGEPGWENMSTGLDIDIRLDYHGTWIDPAGGIWSVGGLQVAEPSLEGFLTYYGTMDLARTPFDPDTGDFDNGDFDAGGFDPGDLCGIVNCPDGTECDRELFMCVPVE